MGNLEAGLNGGAVNALDIVLVVAAGVMLVAVVVVLVRASRSRPSAPHGGGGVTDPGTGGANQT